ncbi:heparan-alpha-glucosaminide N-acetyltransferase domain-containing protein [Microbacterium sp. NPDC077663]|uniref:heparan-alpha-glucosaminide N-acetyltransferase domain-containing protein n=1 Tax=Microbacterium sp. NPDC077663 TaxID=3364189 RepID=UPI0037C73C69
MAAPAAVTRAWRSWNGPARLHGIDLARALAVFGMLAAHLLTIKEPLRLTDPSTWMDVVNGRSSILFALLAGVSIALITGGRMPHRGTRLGVDRRRLAVRAVVLWAIGLLLIQTGVPIYVILPAYGILFLLALPLLTLPIWALWAIAASVGVVVPWVLPALDALPIWEGLAGETLFLVVGWAYPFPLWIAFVVAGMALGRTDLRRAGTQALILAAGVAVVALGSTIGLLADAGDWASPDSYAGAVLSAEAHSGGIVEVVSSTGFAMAVLGACLLVCRTPLTWVLAPVRAVGSMPLTAYVGQVLAWAVVALAVFGDTTDLRAFRDLHPLGWFCLGAIVLCSLWALLVGRGPLESALAAVSRRVVPTAAGYPADRVET